MLAKIISIMLKKKEFFNKVSKVVLEQQNGKLIVLLGGILSRTNII